MLQDKYNIKQLIRMAFLTSPLIGIYSIAPIVLFIVSFPSTKEFIYFLDFRMIFIGIVIFTLIVLIQWFINILLLKLLQPIKIISRKPWTRYIISYAATFLYIAVVSIVMNPIRPVEVGLFSLYPYFGGIANNSFILIIFALTNSQSKSAQLEIEKAQLEVTNLIAQQEQLKHKIQPHFLFNSLNTLKLLIKKEPDLAESYLVQLSTFLRASITELVKDTVTIKEDLSFCKNYLNLQKVRFKNAINFNYSIPELVLENFYLPVFSLQALAENAIKHNAFTSNNPLNIEISYNSDQTLTFRNNLLPKTYKVPSTGTGLENLSQRFEILSSTKPSIYKDEKEGIFVVNFKILNK